MFLKQYEGWKMEGTSCRTLKCTHCNNTADHFVYVAPYGPQLGIVFMRKPLVGMRKYFLACPVCGFLAQELTREQAESLRE